MQEREEIEGWFMEDMHGERALRRPIAGQILHTPKQPFTSEKARRFRQLRETEDLQAVSLLTSTIPLRDPPIKINGHYEETVSSHTPQHEEDFFLNYEPVPEAREGLQQIASLNKRITIATGTPECCAFVLQKMVIDDKLDSIVDPELPMMMTRVPQRIAYGLWPGVVTTTDTKLLDGLYIKLAYGILPDLGDDSPYLAWLYKNMLGGTAFLYEEEGYEVESILLSSEYDISAEDFGVKGGVIIPVVGKGIPGAAAIMREKLKAREESKYYNFLVK
ncbi:hypothetical protein A3C59_05060 [Candidatus Daviesbacteria bacterium RIFCSPHIGHO2_02_FULL_36_13]|uniref:Uncharacterized protein n=1 Tax=Candidatus Daviesbacteria bacterium RIFCSPHIGHO2_02_FULL_36_13 TaxID=1797768 RepID=A0A1F5JXZ7_9BACT|nr:MAG: hypothetical protein A3C59_05060 [Candidatus Daviesbacteria bacterium RIFCSPHIGHO2_02_FULL_36_13]OGE41606.1 MAG: hypothetical protein A3A45_00735 [Candidatus Daviesbacteria bacterium RIFCSPLOWO2_01_FULL_36_8]